MRLLVFCWEVGSAGALIPLVRHAISEGWQILDASLEPGASILKQAVPGLERCQEGAEVRGLADVAVAGVGHPKHASGWSRWKTLNQAIPSLVVLDHWKGLERFQTVDGSLNSADLPRKICVIDDLVEARLSNMGVPREKIEIIGNMAIIKAAKSEAGDDGQVLRKELGLAKDTPLYFLASETLHRHSFHEPCNENCWPLEQHLLSSGQNLLEWTAVQAAADSACLALRPHPNQPLPEQLFRNIRVVPWSIATDDKLLAIASKVWGLSSMITAKAVASGKETENLAPLLEGWTPEQSFMDQEVWGGLVQRGVFGSKVKGKHHCMASADASHILKLLEILGA